MNFIVNVPVIVGLILLFAGVVTRRFPPRKINVNYGYRTKRSMKNPEAWNYAQSVYPVLLMKGGMGLVLLGILMWLLDSSQPAVAIAGITGMFVVIILLYVNVERKLKQFERSRESNSNS